MSVFQQIFNTFRDVCIDVYVLSQWSVFHQIFNTFRDVCIDVYVLSQ